MRKFFLSALLALGCSFTSMAAGDYVNVVCTDGVGLSVERSAIDRIELGTSEIRVVKLDQTASTFDKSTVAKIEINGSDLSAVSDVTSSSLRIYPSIIESSLWLEGLGEESELTVYRITGDVAARAICKPGRNQIDLSSLSAGLYIVNVGTTTTKIVKK